MNTFQYIVLLLISTFAKVKSEENSLVEVRAVFINCEPNERDGSTENDATRFEREELFKHSVLQDCTKKIALTVKIASEPNNSGDEYIPIEHVFRGQNKRVRLLVPYVLRLRRETPLQAYKLRRMATVNGVFSDINGKIVRDSNDIAQNPRLKRAKVPEDISGSKHNKDCELTEKCTNYSVCLNKRDKRHEHSTVAKETLQEEKYPRWMANDDDSFIEQEIETNRSSNLFAESQDYSKGKIERLHRNLNDQKSKQSSKEDRKEPNNIRRSNSWSSRNEDDSRTENNIKIDWDTENRHGANKDYNDLESQRKDNEKKYPSSGKEFDMYEIGNPDLLYNVQVQLFEKLTSPEGKTVWNDITKGEPASVNTLAPEWIGQDMNIRYRPTEWIPREAFTLPLTTTCLLTPILNSHIKRSDTESVLSDAQKFIVVPKEDIMSLEDSTLQKRDGNNYTDEQDSTITPVNEQRRRVLIRTSRAIFGGKEDDMNIVVSGGEVFLTLPHARPHHAQIDLEARADENQLVHIGSSGRIMTVVSDSSRRTRTTLTLQITNTGLAAARFRTVARDCGPELVGLQNGIGETFSDSPILLPPRHTRSVRLDVPAEIPVDVTHCLVSLVNDEEESVAVRDVTIKKGDRCFCVWHCECVCLSEDPKLLCREMPEGRQMAAGLSIRDRVRHARSICYHDVVSINMIVTAFGVLITLLVFGLVKGCLGLYCRCVGTWGLHRLLQMPRKLDHYYESSLRDCSVVYDAAGWPVHPRSMERTVRLVSKPMEFILNIIFFVTTPCIIIYEIPKQIYKCFKKSDVESGWIQYNKEKKNSSSQDIQVKKKRRHQIKKWMTPVAEDLASNLWQESLSVKYQTTMEPMRPLLREEFSRGENMVVQRACADSEGDDTEYVLMQMHKSKESLAISQRKLNGSAKK